MEVGVKVLAEDIRTRDVRHANSCFFTMVALDDDGRPAAVPPLQLGDATERCRFEAARLRRQLRQELAHRFEQIRQAPNPDHDPV